MALANVELEQNILGCLMLNGEAMTACAGTITPDDFADQLHREIYRRIADRISAGESAGLAAMRVSFDGDPALSPVGGTAYLVRLAGAAISLFAMRDHAKLLRQLGDKRRLAEVLKEGLSALDSPDGTVAGVLGAVEVHAMAAEDTAGAQVISFKEAVRDALSGAKEAYESDGIPGCPTGVTALDELTGGLFPGDLTIIGGRPSMGKTALALAMALNAARAGKGVAIASLEMTADSLAIRAVSEATATRGFGVPYTDARRGDMTEAQVEALIAGARDVAGLPIRIIPPNVRDLGGLYSAARRCKRLFDDAGTPLSMLLVDYLQLIRSPKASRYDQVSEISMGLKGLAMSLDVPVVALSQLSRQVESREDKRPVLSDLRESGQLEQDADAIMFCYRPEYYLRRDKPDESNFDEVADWHRALSRCAGLMDIILAKHRMGEIGTVRVRFEDRFNRVTDYGGAA